MGNGDDIVVVRGCIGVPEENGVIEVTREGVGVEVGPLAANGERGAREGVGWNTS